MYKPPTLLMLGLCDEVIFDSKTGKFSLLNVFSEVEFSAFPASRKLVFFFEVQGYENTSVNIAIQILDKYGNMVKEVGDTAQVLEGKDRLMYTSVINAHFAEAGTYTFKLFFNGMEYEENRLHLKVSSMELKLPELVKKHFG